jgi:hypothetical protein
MSASASLLTGKNHRRVLQALIAATLLALGIAAGPGTAHASNPIFTPAEVQVGGGHCTVSGWPHGEIFCGTSEGANLPNGTQEIFGVGLDGAVWTDWGTEASPSGWQSMGAPSGGCAHSGRLSIANYGNYELSIGCDDNGIIRYRYRSAGPNGGWSGWI